MIYAKEPTHYLYRGSMVENTSSQRKLRQYLRNPFEDYLRLRPDDDNIDQEIRTYVFEQDMDPPTFQAWLLRYYFQYFRLGSTGKWARVLGHAPSLRAIMLG